MLVRLIAEWLFFIVRNIFFSVEELEKKCLPKKGLQNLIRLKCVPFQSMVMALQTSKVKIRYIILSTAIKLIKIWFG